MTLCECGCGQEAKPGNMFIWGHQNKGRKHTEENNQKNREAQLGKKASRKTRQKMSESNMGRNAGMKNGMFGKTGDKHPLYGKKGKNSPNWNPDRTDEERQDDRSYSEYNEWRKAVFERDNYECQICGNEGVYLNAHHLEGYVKNPECRTTLENGITLCKTCHNNFHHCYGYNNTKEQFDEFKEA